MSLFDHFGFLGTDRGISRCQKQRRSGRVAVCGQRRRLAVEALKRRAMLSSGAFLDSHHASTPDIGYRTFDEVARTGFSGASYTSPGENGSVGASPAQIRHAYGFDQLSLDGTGQTIAIIDMYYDPTAYTDLLSFDAYYGIPDPPSFLAMAEDGSSNFQGYLSPGQVITVNGQQQTITAYETALDIEWAHAIAPKANILLVEANLNQQTQTLAQQDANLFQAVNTARNYQGVSVVSMSLGRSEDSSLDPTDNTELTTPAGHVPVAFVAATGDLGAPGEYPAFSPNVIAAGGTTLTIDTSGSYLGETVWNDTHMVNGKSFPGATGGGTSQFETQPSYQSATINSRYRTIPDVSSASDEIIGGTLTGVWTRDNADNSSAPWIQQWGTSLSAPTWAGLIALADQARNAEGLGTLDGPSQLLPELYSTPQANLHDITRNGNGSTYSTYPAAQGYDLASGRGSEVASYVVPALVQKLSPSSEATANGQQVADFGDLNSQSLFAVDQNGNVDQDSYSYSNGTHTRFPIDRVTTFSQGSALTEYNDTSSINIFAVGEDKFVHWIQYSSAGGWTDSVVDSNTTFAPGTAIALYATPNTVDLFAVGSDGYAKQDGYDAATGQWSGFFNIGTMQFVAGTPLSIAPISQIVMFGILPDGNVSQIGYSSGWHQLELQGLSAGFVASSTNPGSPLTVIAPGGYINIFGVNANGYVAQVAYNGTQWVGFPIGGTNQWGLAAGAPVTAAVAGSTIEIFGINANGTLVQVSYSGNWSSGTLAFSGFVPSSQLTINLAGGVIEVFGRLATGHLTDVAYSYPSWNEYDLG